MFFREDLGGFGIHFSTKPIILQTAVFMLGNASCSSVSKTSLSWWILFPKKRKKKEVNGSQKPLPASWEFGWKGKMRTCGNPLTSAMKLFGIKCFRFCTHLFFFIYQETKQSNTCSEVTHFPWNTLPWEITHFPSLKDGISLTPEAQRSLTRHRRLQHLVSITKSGVLSQPPVLGNESPLSQPVSLQDPTSCLITSPSLAALL